MKEGRVMQVQREITYEDASGEFIGVAKFSVRGMRPLSRNGLVKRACGSYERGAVGAVRIWREGGNPCRSLLSQFDTLSRRQEDPVNQFGIAIGVITATVIGGALLLDRSVGTSEPTPRPAKQASSVTEPAASPAIVASTDAASETPLKAAAPATPRDETLNRGAASASRPQATSSKAKSPSSVSSTRASTGSTTSGPMADSPAVVSTPSPSTPTPSASAPVASEPSPSSSSGTTTPSASSNPPAEQG